MVCPATRLFHTTERGNGDCSPAHPALLGAKGASSASTCRPPPARTMASVPSHGEQAAHVHVGGAHHRQHLVDHRDARRSPSSASAASSSSIGRWLLCPSQERPRSEPRIWRVSAENPWKVSPRPSTNPAKSRGAATVTSWPARWSPSASATSGCTSPREPEAKTMIRTRTSDQTPPATATPGVCQSGVMVAPTGEQFEIAAGGYRAVVTEGGATLRVLEYDGRPLVDGFERGRDARAAAGASCWLRGSTGSATATTSSRARPTSSPISEVPAHQRLARPGALGRLDPRGADPQLRQPDLPADGAVRLPVDRSTCTSSTTCPPTG